MKAQLVEFIKGNERDLTIVKGDSMYIFITHDISKNLSFIYMTKTYIGRYSTNEDKRLHTSDKFVFAGIFNRKDEEIYFASWDLTRVLGKEYNVEYYNESYVAKRFSTLVENRVKEIIDNDVKNIESYEDKSEFYNYDRNVSETREYRRNREARELVMQGTRPEAICFDVSLNKQETNTSTLIGYLEHGDDFIETYSQNYISLNKKSIQYKFIVMEVLKEDLENLYKDTENDIHIRKAIKDGIDAFDCKTVNVTTVIDGKELTFKTESCQFTRDGGYYSTYDIVAKDRKEFELLYGRNANYNPKDITKITYGKKELYSK